MYERFTDRARKVMQFANQEAQRYQHMYIGTEHILLGLIAEGSGVAANVLRNLDIDLRKVRTEVNKIVQAGGQPGKSDKLPQTPRAKKVIEYAIEESRSLDHNYVGTEHLLLGLLREEEAVAAQVLMNLGLDLDTVRQEVRNILGFAGREPPGGGSKSKTPPAESARSKSPAIDSTGRDLTELARTGKLEPVVSRPAPLQALADVLGCRRRNSAILLGEPGVGKTTLVEELAQAIVARDVPDWLDGCRIVELSLSRLWINVQHETDFDHRLRGILKEARRGENIVLFMPEALRLLATPEATPALPVLHGEWLDVVRPVGLRFILAGTTLAYQDCLNRHIALARCCQTIPVPSATVDETVMILRSHSGRYEADYHVGISESAIIAAASLADRNLPGVLPGKALQLLDRAAVRVRRRGTNTSRDIRKAAARLDQEIERLDRQKEEAVAEQAFADAARFRDEADLLKKEKDALLNEQQQQRQRQDQSAAIDAPAVLDTVRDLLGGAEPVVDSQVTALIRPVSS
jgi:ATP-dependent Clp protease ATP-binding subunit ClpC